MNLAIKTLFAGLALILAGCGTTYEAAKAAYDNAIPCCKNLSEIRYQNLAEKEITLIDVNQSSQVFTFDSGKSYVAAFEIPRHDATISFRLKSYLMGDSVDESHVFFPKVMVLDSRYSLLNEYSTEGLAIVHVPLKEAYAENPKGINAKLEADFPLSADARYIVIYTTADILSKITVFSVSIAVPIIAPGVVAVIPTSRYRNVNIRHSPFGRLSLLLE